MRETRENVIRESVIKKIEEESRLRKFVRRSRESTNKNVNREIKDRK